MTPTLIGNTSALTALRNSINGDPILGALPNNSDGWFAIAAAYNLSAVPNFTVWKTNVSITQVGDNINATELAGLTTLNATRLQTIAMYSAEGVNPSLADRRQFFDDIFSGAGGAITRPKLLALWKRFGTRAEKLYATGTGTDVSPATMVEQDELTSGEVQAAKALP